MGVIRMAHLSNFPDPEELIESLGKSTKVGLIEKSIVAPNNEVSDNYQFGKGMDINKPSQNKKRTDNELKPNCQKIKDFNHNSFIGNFPEFSDLLDLIRQKRDLNLLIEIESHLKLVSYELGRIEFQLKENASSDFPKRLSDVLQKWTGFKWELLLKNDGGNETILEGKARKEEIEKKTVMSDITVKAVLKSFPGAKIAKSTFHTEEDKNIIPKRNEII
jgi:DNA polymerase-3 subunit gamma/tau